MPVITAKEGQRPMMEGNAPPRQHITAQTRGLTFTNPFSAPDDIVARVETEQSQEAQSSGQPSTPVEETRSQEAVTLSPKLSALARREQKFRQQEQQFKAEQEKLKQEREALSKLSQLKTKIESKDFSALEELGISYEDYTNYLINKADGQDPVKSELSDLKKEIESLKTSQEEQVNKQYEATVNQYRSEIKQLVSKDPQFESIKDSGNEDAVLQLILETFEEDGEILTVEEAAQEVEKFIVEDTLATATKLRKVREKLVPPKPQLPPPQRQGLKTLTNNVVPPSTKPSGAQFQHLSPKERLMQALNRVQKQV